MTQRHALTSTKTSGDGPLEPDSTLLRIITADDGMILELTPPRFREANARTIEIRQAWTELGQTTINEFRIWIDTVYGTSLMVIFEGAG